MKKVVLGTVVVVILAMIGTWVARVPLSRLFPIHHEGQLKRIEKFHKGGISSRSEGTRQLSQFALIFEDGFICEGTDTAFAAIQQGDVVKIRAYHDVYGWPLLNPEFWECDEAQLVELKDDAAYSTTP